VDVAYFHRQTRALQRVYIYVSDLRDPAASKQHIRFTRWFRHINLTAVQ
jgi:hypothetical protein